MCRQLGVARIVVGHTVQLSGKVSVLCEGQLLLAHVGLSREIGMKRLGDVSGIECGLDQTAGTLTLEQENDKVGQEECKWVPNAGEKKQDNVEAGHRRGSSGVLRIWTGEQGSKPTARVLKDPTTLRTLL